MRERVNKTYGFFAYGLTSTAVAAYAATRGTTVMRFMTTRPFVVSVVFVEREGGREGAYAYKYIVGGERGGASSKVEILLRV